MAKYIAHGVAILLLAIGWVVYLKGKSDNSADRATRVTIMLEELEREGALTEDGILDRAKNAKGADADMLEELHHDIAGKDYNTDEIYAAMKSVAGRGQGKSTGFGIFLFVGTAVYAGISFVIHILPMLAHKATHSIFDSGEEVEEDKMRTAHGKVAQGDYEGAIAAFREAADANPSDRMPWVEIVKIQRTKLNDSALAAETLREALQSHPWQENDAAFLLFRLAEIHDEDLADRDSAIAIMNQVMEQFPETRHSANARHKLHEWSH